MAVVMSNILGYDAPDYAGVAPFVDVPAWAEPFVSACYANGIVAGADATHYNGEATVTAAEAGLMVMKALGYFQFAADFGTDWKLAVITKGSDIDLYDGISANANTALTRNDVAQLVLNTLESVMVKGEQTGSNASVTAPGVSVEITSVVKYEDKKNDADYDKTDEKNDGKMYLVEELYENLSKKDGSDKFGRPGYGWYEKKDEVVFVADEALATYAGADFDKDTLDDDFEDWDVKSIKVVYNGGTDAKVTVDYLEKGIENMFIEVYGDDDDEKIETIVAYQYYFAEVTAVNTDDDDEVTSVEITINEVNADATIKIDVEDDEDQYALVKDYEEEDLLMVVAKPGFDTNEKASDILAVADVEVVEGKATAISHDGKYNGWVKIDGEKYTFANEFVNVSTAVAKGSEGAFYLFNDYVVAFDGDASDAEAEYLYLVRANEESGKWDTSYYAEVVFADGTCEEIYFELGEKKELGDYGAGTYEYDYDEDDDIYTLTPAGEAKTVSIEKGKTAVAQGIKANGKTVYVAIELDKGAFEDATVATGYKNVTSIDGTAFVISDNGTAEYVFVIDGKTSTSASDLIYVAGTSVSEKIEDDDLGDYWTYNAVIDGEIVEIMADKGTYTGVYDETETDKNGIYTLAWSTKNTVYNTTGSFKKAADEVITLGAAGEFAYAKDVAMYVIDADGDITEGNIGRNYSESDTTAITIRYTLNDNDEVECIFLIKADK